MPLIEVQALPQAEGVDVSALLQNLCEQTASILGVPLKAVRGVWRTLEPGRYNDGGILVGAQPKGSHPPIIRVTALEGRTPETVERLLEALARVAGDCWIVYDVKPWGTIYTDGAIKRRKP